MGEPVVNGTKIMRYTPGKNIRELVDYANSKNIPREDIISIIKEANSYYLVYYY